MTAVVWSCYFFFFFFSDTATTEIYTLSLHDALPILPTVLHDTEKLGSDLLIMIQYVDGTRTHDEIAAAMMKHVLSGELICQKKDVPVTDEAELRPLLKEIVKSGLRILADKAYLVA